MGSLLFVDLIRMSGRTYWVWYFLLLQIKLLPFQPEKLLAAFNVSDPHPTWTKGILLQCLSWLQVGHSYNLKARCNPISKGWLHSDLSQGKTCSIKPKNSKVHGSLVDKWGHCWVGRKCYCFSWKSFITLLVISPTYHECCFIFQYSQ